MSVFTFFGEHLSEEITTEQTAPNHMIQIFCFFALCCFRWVCTNAYAWIFSPHAYVTLCVTCTQNTLNGSDSSIFDNDATPKQNKCNKGSTQWNEILHPRILLCHSTAGGAFQFSGDQKLAKMDNLSVCHLVFLSTRTRNPPNGCGMHAHQPQHYNNRWDSQIQFWSHIWDTHHITEDHGGSDKAECIPQYHWQLEDSNHHSTPTDDIKIQPSLDGN